MVVKFLGNFIAQGATPKYAVFLASTMLFSLSNYAF